MDIYSYNDISNRDRSYSRDSVQYASESSASTITNGQNRDRANTGDSSLSSDTNMSNLSMGPRRRSHRPRGCRGGRKHRKKKNKVPAEIIGPTSSSSSSSTASTATISVGSATSSVSSIAKESTLGMHHPPQKTTDRTAPTLASATQQSHGAIYRRLHDNSSYSQISTHQYDPTALGDNRSALNTSTSYSRNHSNHSNTSNTAHSYTIDTNSSHSIGEYNTNNESIYTGSMGYMTQATVPAFGGILPPPPEVPNQSETFNRGPNPYALAKQPVPALNTDSTFSSFTGNETLVVDENYGYHHQSNGQHHVQQAYRPPMNLQKPPTMIYSSLALPSSCHHGNTSATHTSLFAVSPRSFLTGGPGNNNKISFGSA